GYRRAGDADQEKSGEQRTGQHGLCFSSKHRQAPFQRDEAGGYGRVAVSVSRLRSGCGAARRGLAHLGGGRWDWGGEGGFGGFEKLAQGVDVIGSGGFELGPAVRATRAEVGLDGVDATVAIALEQLDEVGPGHGAGAEEGGLAPRLTAGGGEGAPLVG